MNKGKLVPQPSPIGDGDPHFPPSWISVFRGGIGGYSVERYVRKNRPVRFFCWKRFYCWFSFIRVLFRQPEAGRNFSTPRPTFYGGPNGGHLEFFGKKLKILFLWGNDTDVHAICLEICFWGQGIHFWHQFWDLTNFTRNGGQKGRF